MKKVLALTAILEGATGLALLVRPSMVIQLLIGDGVSGAGIAVGRVAGLALVSLGLACWPKRNLANNFAPAFRAMLTYSLMVTIYLGYLGVVEHLAGILLWPAVAAHAVLTLLLVAAFWREGPHLDAR